MRNNELISQANKSVRLAIATALAMHDLDLSDPDTDVLLDDIVKQLSSPRIQPDLMLIISKPQD